MGIHYVFKYVGYETPMLKTHIDLLDMYCTSCHTNQDVNGNCQKCPIGQLILKTKQYLQTAYEPDHDTEEKKIIQKIKKEIKKITPHPGFNKNFIFEKKLSKDQLANLRRLLNELQFNNDTQNLHYAIQKIKETKDRKQCQKKQKKKTAHNAAKK